MIIQLIIIQVFTFVGLIFVLRMLFYRQLNAALIRLKSLHEENIAKEEELKTNMEALRRQKEEELAAAKKESGRLIKEAQDGAAKLIHGAQDQAKDQAAKILDKALNNAKQMEADISNRAREEAITMSIQMFKVLFTQQGRDAIQRDFVSEFISDLEKLPEEKFTIKEKLVLVSSAHPLTKQELERITKVLTSKLGIDIDLKQKVDPDIISGLIIQVGALTIDGSLRNKLSKAVSYFRS